MAMIVVGLMIHRDFGISWDEPIQKDIGKEAYNYIHGQPNEYLEMKDKVYGVVFELGIRYVQEWLNITEDKEVYHYRHFCYFLLFSFACFIFFRLNVKLFGNTGIAFVTTMALILSPRIFGHAFINPKDVPFLSMYIISFYTFYNYITKPGIWKLFILAASVGLLINFRIMGILMGMSALFFMFVLGLQQRKLKYFIHGFIFTVVASSVVYVVWPFLWSNPVVNFTESFKAMSKFPWDGEMLFKGKIINAGKYPVTDYLFTWISITLPIGFIVSSVSGMIIFMVQCLKQPLKIFDGPVKIMAIVFLANSITPLLAVVILKSTVYDDWRQLYFIYGGLIAFTGFLLHYLYQWKPIMANIGMVALLCYQTFITFQMVKLHPYQQVYFNEVISKNENYLQQHFDMDYWGTSFYEGLSYIAANDQSDTIPVFVFHEPLVRNSMLLPWKDRNRFIFSKTMTEKRAKYYLTTYRFDYTDLIGNAHFGEIFYEVRRQNSCILKVWKHKE